MAIWALPATFPVSLLSHVRIASVIWLAAAPRRAAHACICASGASMNCTAAGFPLGLWTGASDLRPESEDHVNGAETKEERDRSPDQCPEQEAVGETDLSRAGKDEPD